MKIDSTCLIAASLWLLEASAMGADLPNEGKYDHHGCYIGPHYVIAHSKEQMGGSYAATGASLAPPGDPFYGTSGVCYGAWTLINAEYNEMGSCEFTNAAGDKFMGVYTRKNQEPGNWRIVGGTGKFSGMTGNGNFIPGTPLPQPAGQVVACNRELGTWKLR